MFTVNIVTCYVSYLYVPNMWIIIQSKEITVLFFLVLFFNNSTN